MATLRPDLVHVWNRCGACGKRPLWGTRFECQTCAIGPDSDLCEACHDALLSGVPRHPAGERHAAGPNRAKHVFREVEGKPADLFRHWLAIVGADAAPPDFPSGFVVRPEFRSGTDSFFGAYAFVVSVGPAGPPLVLTALHVMDELIKHRGVRCGPEDGAYTGRELPALIDKVQLYDVCAANWMLAELGSAESMLHLPDARVGEEEPYAQRDIAAFRLHSGDGLSPVPLAAAAPGVGEPVWLMTSPPRSGKRQAIKAVVVEQTERTLVFRYSAPAGPPPACSGSPLLNRWGEVVGIKIGAGFLDGHALGHANHVTSIRRHLGISAS